MARTYCGKSCDECSYKEELSCPGCLAGPGKPFYAECDLAQCCQIKCHESCETCSIQPHCGKLRGKERIPEQRIRNRQAEAEHLASVRSRTPVLAKWLWLLLWPYLWSLSIKAVPDSLPRVIGCKKEIRNQAQI